jgi:hypothetical protein
LAKIEIVEAYIGITDFLQWMAEAYEKARFDTSFPDLIPQCVADKCISFLQNKQRIEELL